MVEDSNGGGRRGKGETGGEKGKRNKDVTRFFLLGVGRCYGGEWRRNLLGVWFYGGFRCKCYMNNICHGREGGVPPPPVRVEQWGPYHPFSKFFLFFPRGWVVNDL